MIRFFDIWLFSCFCSGILVFCFIENISVEEPNRPVRRGSRLFVVMFNEAIPKNPASIKINIAGIFCSSFDIKNMLIQIRISAINLCMNGNIFGIENEKKGIIIINEITAIVEPISVKIIA